MLVEMMSSGKWDQWKIKDPPYWMPAKYSASLMDMEPNISDSPKIQYWWQIDTAICPDRLELCNIAHAAPKVAFPALYIKPQGKTLRAYRAILTKGLRFPTISPLF